MPLISTLTPVIPILKHCDTYTDTKPHLLLPSFLFKEVCLPVTTTVYCVKVVKRHQMMTQLFKPAKIRISRCQLKSWFTSLQVISLGLQGWLLCHDNYSFSCWFRVPWFKLGNRNLGLFTTIHYVVKQAKIYKVDAPHFPKVLISLILDNLPHFWMISDYLNDFLWIRFSRYSDTTSHFWKAASGKLMYF